MTPAEAEGADTFYPHGYPGPHGPFKKYPLSALSSMPEPGRETNNRIIYINFGWLLI
jgi:hypothetical protein